MKQEFKTELTEKTKEAERVISRFLPQETGYQKTLNESVNYSVTAGGKRLRPIIMKETFRLFGGTEETIDYFMAAMEMIHSASLVHDDLPCMDNDEYRRGRHTTWYVYHEDMATLAGDDLFIYPFEVASEAFAVSEYPRRVGRAIGVLAAKAGHNGMIGGQSVDVEYTDRPLTAEQLDFIYRLKTGALLEAAMMIGAVLAGADEETVAKVETIASYIGMAFQIRDDILDITGDEAVIGKPVMSDVKNNKTTYVSLYGMEQAKAKVAECSEEGIRMLRALVGGGTFLEELFRTMVTREK